MVHWCIDSYLHRSVAATILPAFCRRPWHHGVIAVVIRSIQCNVASKSVALLLSGLSKLDWITVSCWLFVFMVNICNCTLLCTFACLMMLCMSCWACLQPFGCCLLLLPRFLGPTSVLWSQRSQTLYKMHCPRSSNSFATSICNKVYVEPVDVEYRVMSHHPQSLGQPCYAYLLACLLLPAQSSVYGVHC